MFKKKEFKRTEFPQELPNIDPAKPLASKVESPAVEPEPELNTDNIQEALDIVEGNLQRCMQIIQFLRSQA